VSDQGQPGPDPDNPFVGIPFLGDLMRLVGSSGAASMDTAAPLALSIATDGKPEPNVDPLERIRFEELARVADLHLSQVEGLTLPGAKIVPVTRAMWAQQALREWKPRFDRFSAVLSRTPPPVADLGGDPFAAMMANLSRMVAPMWMGMMTGTMVGHLAKTAFGPSRLPLPHRGTDIPVVAANVTTFAEDWSLDVNELRMWVCLAELTQHAVLSVPHVRAALDAALDDYVDAFEPNPAALEDKLESLDPSALSDPAGLQKLFADPEIILGAVRSPAQVGVLPRIEVLVAVLAGYVDHVLDTVGARLLGSGGRLAEAVRRQRVEASEADRFVERLLGLELTQATFDRGAAFVDGVVERAGEAGVARLWERASTLPTPAELDAPGLWLARLEFDSP
jgi:putative hydrolase